MMKQSGWLSCRVIIFSSNSSNSLVLIFFSFYDEATKYCSLEYIFDDN